ncbi:MAG: hydrogenase maturation protease [Actinomycetota bacterium]
MNSSGKNISKDHGFGKTDIKIVGFGNKFRSDDGIGIRVIKELQKLDIFKDIEIIDGGTSGTDLIFWIKNCRKIIIIDAVDTGGKIGDVVNIKVDDIEEFVKKDCRSLSLHDLNLADILKLIKALGIKTDISIIGIKPKSIDFGDRLSPEIERKIPAIISEIKKET